MDADLRLCVSWHQIKFSLLQITSNSDCLGEACTDVSCPTLKTLDLSNNSFEAVPVWLKSTTTNLEILNLSSNFIKFLPEESFGMFNINGD